MHDIELTGLDGSNLLAYLAGLGALRVLTLAMPNDEVRMAWVDRGCWTPVICHSRVESAEGVLEILRDKLCGESSINAAWKIGDDLNLRCSDFRDHLRRTGMEASTGNREDADFLTAFGSDVYGTVGKKETMSDTEFRTMSGAGHQHFLGFMRELAVGTDADQLRRTLFEIWDYEDDRPSLRWDPGDYRPHALRAVDPSGDPIKTMRGANRLAIEALPLFPTVPQDRRIRTMAFEDRPSGTEISWPIWTDPLELRTIASLVAYEGVQRGSRDELRPLGIVQVFRARRFTEGKYRNFSPARAML
jgi:hypothetical protein